MEDVCILRELMNKVRPKDIGNLKENSHAVALRIALWSILILS